MKLFLRIALLALLFASVWQAANFSRRKPGDSSDSSFSSFPRMPLESIRQRGELRLAVLEGSLSYFYYQGDPSGFEYDLLSRFASDLNVSLVPMAVRSPAEGALLLVSRRADLAVLPTELEQFNGASRIGPYLRPGLRENDLDSSLPETGALFVRDDSKELTASLTDYLIRSATDGTIKILFERYFVYNRQFSEAVTDAKSSGRMPGMLPFGPLIAKHAATAGFDWRLVAALIGEESTFDADAVSPKGAIGLMQLMPEVAREVGLRNSADPEANIRAGVQHLKHLWKMFADTRGEGKLELVLAAYLVGPGHILDAQRLARDLGLDPDQWAGGLEDVLPLLEKPRFYKETRFGFARGQDAVEYVNRVLGRYDFYKRLLPPQMPATANAERSDKPA